jgi:hypothetical protein
MPINKFEGNSASYYSYTRAVAITANDSTDVVETTRAIVVDHASSQHANVSVILKDDTTAVTIPIRVGLPFPIRATRIRATGTNASSIVALY